MASETVTAGLKNYAIGSKLRRLRLRKSMGLVELSRHTGLSPALLSKLERDVMHPTLPTLLRIAMVFSVGLEYFFNPETKPVLAIVRKKIVFVFLTRPMPARRRITLRVSTSRCPIPLLTPTSRNSSRSMRPKSGPTNTPESSSFTLLRAG